MLTSQMPSCGLRPEITAEQTTQTCQQLTTHLTMEMSKAKYRLLLPYGLVCTDWLGSGLTAAAAHSETGRVENQTTDQMPTATVWLKMISTCGTTTTVRL